MTNKVNKDNKLDVNKTIPEKDTRCRGKYVSIIVAIVLAISTLALLIQNHSVEDKLLDQEILNEGLESENQELKDKLDEYYSNSSSETEDGNNDVISLQNELDKANEKIESLQTEITSLIEEKGDEEDILKDLNNIKLQLDEVNANNEKLSSIYEELLSFADSEYLGTEQYHSDQYFIFTDGDEKVIKVTAKSSKKYTTTVTGNNNNVTTEWESPFEGYQAELKLIPKNEGVTQFTFTNSFNSDTFRIIVVYLKE